MRRFCSQCVEEFEQFSQTCPKCGGSLIALSDTSLVGKTVDDKYTVTALLGKGGMGEVYLAKQRYLDREVALKVLRRSTSEQPGAVKRFMLEAKAASGLSSPHTVTIHDFGVTDDGLLYFTMERLKGAPLNEVIADQSPLAPARAVDIAVHVCRSLAEAHAQGIWHRDLKPENIYLVPDANNGETAKVLDFGIAKVPTEGEKLTGTGMICGTPQYLSPEQAQGQELDQRSDIYSLAVVVFEMLAGRPPFASENAVDILVKQINEPAPRVRTFNRAVTIPEALENVLQSALSKNPAARPSCAEEFSTLLQDALGGKEKMSTAPLVSAAPRVGSEATTEPAAIPPPEPESDPMAFEETASASNLAPAQPAPAPGKPKVATLGIALVLVALVILAFTLRPWESAEETKSPDSASPTVAQSQPAAVATTLPDTAIHPATLTDIREEPETGAADSTTVPDTAVVPETTIPDSYKPEVAARDGAAVTSPDAVDARTPQDIAIPRDTGKELVPHPDLPKEEPVNKDRNRHKKPDKPDRPKEHPKDKPKDKPLPDPEEDDDGFVRIPS